MDGEREDRIVGVFVIIDQYRKITKNECCLMHTTKSDSMPIIQILLVSVSLYLSLCLANVISKQRGGNIR